MTEAQPHGSAQGAERRAVGRRRPGGRSARIRTAALAATLAELADRGYAALSIEGVASRTGVHKTTLYRRWGSREELILEAMLEAMLERAGEHISVPDTGSLRDDLFELARTATANAASPEVAAMARTVAAEAPHDSRLAAANRRFWSARLAMDAVIVERAMARGEVATGADPRAVIETVLGPIHLRLLLTGEPIDHTFLEGVVDIVVNGARRQNRS